ncbi:MAG: hypothetical protein NVS9B4_25590 [Candidatus Acidiferrum sp.]
MTKRAWASLVFIFILTASGLLLGYKHWRSSTVSSRDELLALMPADADAVLFADFAELRHAPFFTQLVAWAPKPVSDPDYLKFLDDTGFDYERDLDRIAIAVKTHTSNSPFFIVAEGRFDRKKILTYARKSGGLENRQGHDVYFVSVAGTPRRFYFTFLRKNCLALTDATEAVDFWSLQHDDKASANKEEWRTRFDRLSGSPLFMVMRGPAASSVAPVQAPRGFSSPQLSALLTQMPWISVAGKPDGDALRVVADGECITDTAAHQLADFLNGVIILAENGLNGAPSREQLQPAARAAYLDLLRNTDVSRLDRGEIKSVRLTLFLTSQLLQIAR